MFFIDHREGGREGGGEGGRGGGGEGGRREGRRGRHLPLPEYVNCTGLHGQLLPYSGYFSGGKIFVSNEFLASSWKNFHSRSTLNHTLVLCVTVSWIKISWFTSQP